MIITGMAHFQSVAQKKLVEWYHKNRPRFRSTSEMYLWYGLVRLCKITNAWYPLQLVAMVSMRSIPTTVTSRSCTRMCMGKLPIHAIQKNRR